MDTVLIAPTVEFLQNLSAEWVSLILLLVCTASILALFKYFGAQGLFLYNCVAVIAANIQVLKGAQFGFSVEPIALGTVVFSTTYLCSDILTEHYGSDVAKKGIWLCFAAQLLMTLLMVLAVSHPSLPPEILLRQGTEHMPLAEKAMALLFTPSPRLLVASLLAFIVSQWLDIYLFQMLNKFTKSRWLWLRTNVATGVSAWIDTVLFSILAFCLLTPNPVDYATLFFTYILGTFVARILIGFLSTPIIYLSYPCKPIRQLYVP